MSDQVPCDAAPFAAAPIQIHDKASKIDTITLFSCINLYSSVLTQRVSIYGRFSSSNGAVKSIFP